MAFASEPSGSLSPSSQNGESGENCSCGNWVLGRPSLDVYFAGPPTGFQRLEGIFLSYLDMWRNNLNGATKKRDKRGEM